MEKAKERGSGIEALIAGGRFGAGDLYELLGEDLLGLPCDEGLKVIYEYALSKSFPQATALEFSPKRKQGAEAFLEVFRALSLEERKGDYGTFLSRYPFTLLGEEDVAALEDPREYVAFKRAFEEEYIYEMMKLSQSVTGHATLEHIVGVHYLAMHLAYQLRDLGHAVDLGRVSGAAAGHDLGKFGVGREEVHRVAYYHYYYTDQWFRNRGIAYIRNIAVNHSVWDLELDNLSIESLILIYADFRVKRIKGRDRGMSFYTLAESFSVILDKLDSLDHEKEVRYQRVYLKLKDFENYLEHLGVALDLAAPPAKPVMLGAFSLEGPRILDEWVYRILASNLKTMTQLRDMASLKAFIADARGEQNSFDFRRTIDILRSYHYYMTPPQKILTMDFLMEELLNPKEDIRKTASEIMGDIIVGYDETYKKETPRGAEKIEVRYQRIDLIKKLFDGLVNLDPSATEQKFRWMGQGIANSIAVVMGKDPGIFEEAMGYFMALMQDQDLHGAHRRGFLEILMRMPGEGFEGKDKAVLRTRLIEKMMTEGRLSRHLACDGARRLGIPLEGDLEGEELWLYRGDQDHCPHESQTLYLNNLKSGTPWVDKILAMDHLMGNTPESQGCHLALHLSNLIKVSEYEGVRNHAGKNLMVLSDRLQPHELNDVVVEMMRGMEMESYQFAKFIPEYLAHLLVRLGEEEYSEVLRDFDDKLRRANSYLKNLILKTVAHLIRELYQKGEAGEERIRELVGYLLIGLAYEKDQIGSRTLEILGKEVLGNSAIPLEARKRIFELTGKKVLALLEDTAFGESYRTGVIEIYRLINEVRYRGWTFDFPLGRPVAFFRGTFDPFTRGQKRAALEIAAKGMEVHIAVDEFNWRRQTQPTNLRRQIIKLATAEDLMVFLLPSGFQVNLASEESLRGLSRVYGSRRLHLAVGEETLTGHPAYGRKNGEIYTLPHFIIRGGERHPEGEKLLKERLDRLDHRYLETGGESRDYSASLVRQYVTHHWDLSEILDPLGAQVVEEHRMYRGEPQFKGRVKEGTLEVVMEPGRVMIRNTRSRENIAQVDYHLEGDVMVLTGLQGESQEQLHDYRVSVLTEVFVWGIQNQVKRVRVTQSGLEEEVLRQFNFTASDHGLEVSLSSPMVLIMDGQSMLKRDYRKDYILREGLLDFRKALIGNIGRLFPGKLLLLMDHTFMYQHILRILKAMNPYQGDRLGEAMVVPYGDLFNRWILPGAVTKALHVERCYNREADTFKILAHPNYMGLEDQIRTLKAYGKPVILVDDLLDKGYRLNELIPHFRSEGIVVKGIVAGITTDSGEAVAGSLGVRGAYRLKNISAWFVESQLMPFVGGETLLKGEWPGTTLLPSVNKLLPYMFVAQEAVRDHGDLYAFSRTTLSEMVTFLKVMEAVYLEKTGRPLVVRDLGEIVITPRYPEAINEGTFSEKRPPSELVREDLRFLGRFREIFEKKEA